MQTHRTLRWWTPCQLGELAGRLGACWQRWLGDWCAVPHARGRVDCELGWELPKALQAAARSTHWSLLAGEGARAWLCESSRDERAVCSLLFGSRRAGDVGPAARAVAAAARAALARELAGAIGMADVDADANADGSPQPAGDLFKPWSGAVIATLHAGDGLVLQLLLDAAAVQRAVPHAAMPQVAMPHPPAGEPLVPIESACQSAHVIASARLHDVVIDLGTLAQLRVGDVIPTTHALADPLNMHAAGHTVCAAFLGRRGDARAIELTALPNEESALP